MKAIDMISDCSAFAGRLLTVPAYWHTF